MSTTESQDPVDLSLRGTADAVGVPILEYGRGWMMDPGTAARATELGFDNPFAIWVNGRAGVLGPADADVVASAIGFMAPERVRALWEARPSGLDPHDAALAYADAASTWGRSVLADVEPGDLDRLAELCDRVAAAADASVGVLFAGWRAIERPSDPAGRATVALNVLRELRGGAHLSAVNAVGLGPHGAIMSADDPVRGGAAGAERFGWAAPHPSPDRDRRAEAERITSTIVAPAFAALDEAERAEFIGLVRAARAAMDG